MNDDEYIQDLLKQICSQDPPSTPLVRSRALTKLLRYIQNSPAIWRSSHQDYPIALNRTLERVSTKICQFTPRSSLISRELMRWINGYLKWRIRDLYIDDWEYWSEIESLDEPFGQDEGRLKPIAISPADPSYPKTLDVLEIHINHLQEAELQGIHLTISEYIQHDPDNFLRVCHPLKYPACNCQAIALRHLPCLTDSPETLLAIAADFGINQQTLYSHWREKGLPRLRLIALRFDTQLKEALTNRETQGSLKGCHSLDHPECTCLELTNRLILSDSIGAMKAIAREFGMNESHLWKHWEQKCLPILKNIRCNLEA